MILLRLAQWVMRAAVIAAFECSLGCFWIGIDEWATGQDVYTILDGYVWMAFGLMTLAIVSPGWRSAEEIRVFAEEREEIG
jgi:hypothetical protein